MLKDKKSIKQRIEAHPLIFFLTTLIIGFSAGFTAKDKILEFSDKSILANGSYYLKSEVAGRVNYQSAKDLIVSLHSEGEALMKTTETEPSTLDNANDFSIKAKIFLDSLIDVRSMEGAMIPVGRSAKEIQMIMAGNKDYGYEGLNDQQKLARVVNVLSALVKTFSLIEKGVIE
ncbi:hypothetical protein KA005_03350 [bacterium]|nr:hypothetical protein [bacterium]